MKPEEEYDEHLQRDPQTFNNIRDEVTKRLEEEIRRAKQRGIDTGEEGTEVTQTDESLWGAGPRYAEPNLKIRQIAEAYMQFNGIPIGNVNSPTVNFFTRRV